MNDLYYKPIPVGHNLYISHKDACDSHWTAFPKILHIWRDDIPSYSCNQIRGARHRGLGLHYRDGESFDNANHSIDEIADFLHGDLMTLVHCTAGQTRSPTVAIIGKIVRGCSVNQAISDIMKANWEQRRVVCNFCVTPMKEIFEWAEKKGYPF